MKAFPKARIRRGGSEPGETQLMIFLVQLFIHLGDIQALAQLDRTLTTQAYLLSTDAVMCISGMLMLSLIGLIWWAKPPFTVRGGGH